MKLLIALFMLAPSVALACSSTYDCQVGSKCVKERGALYGTCMGGMNPGNANDEQPVERPMDMNNTYGNTCSTRYDCGSRYRCVKQRGSMYGTCVD
jgi:hypothetical protein